MKEFTHDGEPITKALASLNHQRPASLAGLAVCITGIVPGSKGYGVDQESDPEAGRAYINAYRRRYYLDEICRF